MPNTNPSSNMSLPIPVVGVDPGPQYATDINSCLTLIDQHNHAPGYGVQIPTQGISVNADFPFNSYNATSLRSVRYTSQASALSTASDLTCVYVAGGDLYYNNGSGTAVQITSGNSINASGIGGISGLGGTSAAVTYSSITTVFSFTQDTNKPAPLSMASITLSPPTTSPHGITVNAPNGLSADYALTLPGALPASQSLLGISNAGAMTVPLLTGNIAISGGVVDLVTNPVISGTLKIGGTSGTLLTGSSSTLTLSVTQLQISTNALLLSNGPKAVEVSDGSRGLPLVCSPRPSAGNGLEVIRGTLNSSGVTGTGEGFTCTYNGSGNYTINYSTSFGDVPAVVIQPINVSANIYLPIITSNLSGSTTFQMCGWTGTGFANSPTGFTFTAVGIRA